jgi:LuxR family transcriptional regulator, maltose regulon positive regulatory protein
MPEPSATSPSTATGPAHEVLVATKLHVPRPRPGFLPRPRLVERLTEGMARELVLVCTPVGFGKTTLLGDWARRSRQPVAWLSLDDGDNDPARFWRQVAAALQHASEGVGLCRQLAYPLPLVVGLAALARIRQAQGDWPGALEAIGEAERVQVSSAVVALFNPVPALWARLAMAHGEVGEAAHWVRQRGLAPDDQPSYPREDEYLILARVLLADQASDRALALLERLHDLAVAQGRTGSVIEVRALRALALDAVGDQAGALAFLAEALALAAPEGYLRVFVDEGAPMARLLGRLATAPAMGQAVAGAHVPATSLRRLLHAFDQAGVAVPPGLVVPLSSRELEVLALLGAGTPNQAIAEELVISLHTVKRHVTHIFDKLGAANRTEAVSRARELGLLG